MSRSVVPQWRLETHAVLGSTNDRAIEAAEAGAAPGLAVLARRQTAGRGRRGRQWQSREGNLHLSVLLPAAAPWSGATLPLLAGVAMHEAVAPHLPPSVPLLLKFPNDLLAAGAKLGGVLIEQGGPPRIAPWAVVGIGLNLALHPEDLGRKATSIAASGGHVPTVDDMASSVLERLSAWLTVAAAAGAERVREAWMARSFPSGTEMTVAGDGGSVSGVYRGLDPDGGLRLEVAGCVRRVVSGDIMVQGGTMVRV